MIADGSNLLRILKRSDQLVVPLYQRPYSWSEPEWSQLWSDILRVADGPSSLNHFVGSLVQIGGTALAAGHNPLQLIDGQQRVTTISVLLLALDRLARRRVEADPDDLDAISVANEKLPAHYLVDDREHGERRYKLLPNASDRATYLALIDGAPLPDKPSRGLLNADQFFETQMDACDRPLADLFGAVSRLLVVEIALERGVDDPQLIFESLNSTGLDLTQADLIRNYVLMRLGPSEQDGLYRHYWQPMEDRLKPVGPEGFDRFIRDYLTMRTAQIPRIDRIYRAFKDFAHSSGDDATGIAKDLCRFSAYYGVLVLGSAEDRTVRQALTNLSALKVEVTYPFLLDVLDDHAREVITTVDLVEVLRIVESYVFRRSVVGIPTNTLNKFFASLSREVDEARYLESLTATLLLREGTSRFPRDEEFRRELRRKDIYNFRNRVYLLDRLENHDRKERVEVASYTIEHILPQNPELSPAWQDELGSDWQRVQAEHLHTLGNLTLTGYNSELSDRSFQEKRSMPGGFADSPVRLNASVREHARWTEEAIITRGRRLADEAGTIWPMPVLADEILGRYRHARSRLKGAYTLADHPALQGPLLDLFEQLRRRVCNLDPDVTEVIRKQFIAYRSGRVFVSVVPHARALKFYLAGLDVATLERTDTRIRDVRGIGHWCTGDVEVWLSSAAELDWAMELITAAFAAVGETTSSDDEYPVDAVEGIIEQAAAPTHQQALRRLVAAAVAGGLYPRPRTHSIMFAPPQKRSIALFTVRVRDTGIETFCAPDNWELHAGIPGDRVLPVLGPADWTSAAGLVERLTDGLEELLAEATFPGRPGRTAFAALRP